MSCRHHILICILCQEEEEVPKEIRALEDAFKQNVHAFFVVNSENEDIKCVYFQLIVCYGSICWFGREVRLMKIVTVEQEVKVHHGYSFGTINVIFCILSVTLFYVS